MLRNLETSRNGSSQCRPQCTKIPRGSLFSKNYGFPTKTLVKSLFALSYLVLSHCISPRLWGSTRSALYPHTALLRFEKKHRMKSQNVVQKSVKKNKTGNTISASYKNFWRSPKKMIENRPSLDQHPKLLFDWWRTLEVLQYFPLDWIFFDKLKLFKTSRAPLSIHLSLPRLWPLGLFCIGRWGHPSQQITLLI